MAPQNYMQKICSFKNSENICLLKKIDQMSISVGVDSKNMPLVYCLFCAGAGLSLIHEDFLKLDGHEKIRTDGQPQLSNATSQKASVTETVVFYLRMGDTRVWVVFGVVRSLAVPIL